MTLSTVYIILNRSKQGVNEKTLTKIIKLS